MTTIYLRFANRTEALATLTDRLGWSPSDGTTHNPPGAARSDICFLEDVGLPGTPDNGFLVNILWHDENPPDFGLFAVCPTTPNCVFANA